MLTEVIGEKLREARKARRRHGGPARSLPEFGSHMGISYRAPVETVAVLLAAGKGTRMRSDLAKVLHPFAGEALIMHPLRAAARFGVTRSILVVGHQAEAVREAVASQLARWGQGEAQGQAPEVEYALQAEQLGTGHAVACALPVIDEGFAGAVLILSGDVPLLSAATLETLARACEASSAGLSLASFRPEDPSGYGRILRDESGRVAGIREHKDASLAERAITECNAGVYCVLAEHLRRELPTLGSSNAAGEIYLTDLIALRARAGEVAVVEVDADEVAGVNTPEQLAELERRAVESGRLGASRSAPGVSGVSGVAGGVAATQARKGLE
ncbi:MAG: NTP transferase domain-containing protein [Enhygromyxa sp.]